MHCCNEPNRYSHGFVFPFKAFHISQLSPPNLRLARPETQRRLPEIAHQLPEHRRHQDSRKTDTLKRYPLNTSARTISRSHLHPGLCGTHSSSPYSAIAPLPSTEAVGVGTIAKGALPSWGCLTSKINPRKNPLGHTPGLPGCHKHYLQPACQLLIYTITGT